MQCIAAAWTPLPLYPVVQQKLGILNWKIEIIYPVQKAKWQRSAET